MGSHGVCRIIIMTEAFSKSATNYDDTHFTCVWTREWLLRLVFLFYVCPCPSYGLTSCVCVHCSQSITVSSPSIQMLATVKTWSSNSRINVPSNALTHIRAVRHSRVRHSFIQSIHNNNKQDVNYEVLKRQTHQLAHVAWIFAVVNFVSGSNSSEWHWKLTVSFGT